MGLFSKAAIDKKYVIEKKELGSGNFAVVKKATIKPGVKPADIPEGMGSEVAVKIIDKAKVEDMNDITREIDVMGQLKHPNVIKVCCPTRNPRLSHGQASPEPEPEPEPKPEPKPEPEPAPSTDQLFEIFDEPKKMMLVMELVTRRLTRTPGLLPIDADPPPACCRAH